MLEMESETKSASTVVSGLNIPTKKVHLTNLSQLPDNYCQTPGGTLFAHTPGGTRIIYDRSFLLKMRNSPIASTPPKNLPYIAGVTTGISPESLKENKSPFKKSIHKSVEPVQKKVEGPKTLPKRLHPKLLKQPMKSHNSQWRCNLFGTNCLQDYLKNLVDISHIETKFN